MTKEIALDAFKQMYNEEIDKDNHLFVGTINPEMIKVAIDAIEYMINLDSEKDIYREIQSDAMQSHSTWIIAFRPNTNSFFVTDKRAFYWEFEKEFDSEQDGVSYFEDNAQYFINVVNEMIYSKMVWLENTQQWYFQIK